MPVIKSAIKKVRVDARRRERNVALTSKLKTALKKAHATPSFETLSAAYSALDRAVKTNLVHKNFANRNKAHLGKLAKPVKITGTTPKKSTAKAAPKTSGKIKKTTK